MTLRQRPQGFGPGHKMLQTRFGFTLVELLVVITIIGILMSLLLPAVQQIRQAARNLQCKNHLKQIGLGALNHEATHSRFPANGWGWFWVGDPDLGFQEKQPGGWIYNLLPFIEQTNLRDLGAGEAQEPKKEFATQLTQSVIPIMNCPSRRAAELFANTVFGGDQAVNANPVSEHARSDYAINSGDLRAQNSRGPNSYEQGLNQDQQWWASFGDSSGHTGVSNLRHGVKMAQIRDGVSNTYLVGEKYINPDNYEDGGDGADNLSMYQGQDWDVSRWTADPPLQDRPGVLELNRFGGVHSGGVNFVFCDGSVHSINWGIDPLAHRHLGNRSDGQVIDTSELGF